MLEQFSHFLANFSLFSGGGKSQYFSYCFPISDRSPENTFLAGGQGRKSTTSLNKEKANSETAPQFGSTAQEFLKFEHATPKHQQLMPQNFV